MWDPFLRCSSHPGQAYDLLGLGAAAATPGPYELDDYVHQFLAEAPLEPVDVIGFSMGALIAQAVALDSPGRVRRLVLVSAVHGRDEAEQQAIVRRVELVRSGAYADSIEPALTRWFTPEFALANPDVIDDVRQRMLANDPVSYAHAYSIFATADAYVAPQATMIQHPTLVITGSDDERSTPSMTATLAKRLPHGSAVVVQGVRHMLPVEAPAALADHIDRFLDDTDAKE